MVTEMYQNYNFSPRLVGKNVTFFVSLSYFFKASRGLQIKLNSERKRELWLLLYCTHGTRSNNSIV